MVQDKLLIDILDTTYWWLLDKSHKYIGDAEYIFSGFTITQKTTNGVIYHMREKEKQVQTKQKITNG